MEYIFELKIRLKKFFDLFDTENNVCIFAGNKK